MLDALDNYQPAIRSVLHPTDCSHRGDQAFAHALAFALIRETKLTLLHVGPAHSKRVKWSRFPAVRQTLERWGLLESGSPQSAVQEQLNMRVKKVSVPGFISIICTATTASCRTNHSCRADGRCARPPITWRPIRLT